MRNLRRGSRGRDVITLQTYLRDRDYFIKVDGDYGNRTVAVVKAWQKDNRLTTDGNYGPTSQRTMPSTGKMRYQEFWLDRQTQIIKIKHSTATFDLIDIEKKSHGRATLTVKSLWRMLKNKPTVLFSGGLFDTRTGADLNIMVVDGERAGSIYYSKDGLCIDPKGKMRIGFVNPSTYNFRGGSPTIVRNGKRLTTFPNLVGSFITSRHPRIAFGTNEEYVYAVIVNGRSYWRGWRGMSIKELANMFIYTLGCTDAYNDDGGGSIASVRKNGSYWKYGSRGVANATAIYVEGH